MNPNQQITSISSNKAPTNRSKTLNKVTTQCFGQAGYEISAAEINQVSGGEIKITPAPKIPEYIPLSQSNPKVERDLPRVPYR
ncbi:MULTISPECIES: hypothetical protein [Methylomonas]|uniref:Uncharacterized protein n=2 Tax=Methylomonas TaxID=416 RepID=A0A140E3M1_9GAMM|nr:MULTISPECIES: hypothetical protein [Methylomonas]AMK74995.1 hypothetical protein JT25_000590 [Methylomonas denitrificans]OAI02492.1 hypothetical protein A1342_01590 [Methylomonas methanica]TCV83192.1 hypothetical protein EDE11_110151 [Methylomonas methanica]